MPNLYRLPNLYRARQQLSVARQRTTDYLRVFHNGQVRMNELEGSRMFVNLSRHSTRSSVARQRSTRSSVARQVWNGLHMDDAPGTNLAPIRLHHIQPIRKRPIQTLRLTIRN
uniref:Uncharacterized protein n=1 Tax=Gadus morhua TaxID=8049 RepID=A0A8C5B283_GADMO